MNMQAQQHEVDRNYDFFQRNLSRMLFEHGGQYALLRSCEVVDYFAQPGSACDEGVRRFPDGIFSIQEVTDEPIHLGFWSIADA